MGRNININQQDKYYRITPLYEAVNNKHVDVVRLLVSHRNINVNLQFNTGRSVLHLAAGGGNLEIVRILLSHQNININLQSTLLGMTPLMEAVYNVKKDVVELLINRREINLDVQYTGENSMRGYTALDLAKRNLYWGRTASDIVALLQSKGAACNMKC